MDWIGSNLTRLQKNIEGATYMPHKYKKNLNHHYLHHSSIQTTSSSSSPSPKHFFFMLLKRASFFPLLVDPLNWFFFLSFHHIIHSESLSMLPIAFNPLGLCNPREYISRVVHNYIYKLHGTLDLSHKK